MFVYIALRSPYFMQCWPELEFVNNHAVGDSVVVKREQSSESDAGSVHTPERSMSNTITEIE